MTDLLHELVTASAERYPEAEALVDPRKRVTYGDLESTVRRAATGLVEIGVRRGDRVAIYLPKHTETVAGFFAATRAGGVFVPVNPVLKAQQVAHILRDSGAKVLITSSDRLGALEPVLPGCDSIECVVLLDSPTDVQSRIGATRVIGWGELCESDTAAGHRVIDTDVAGLLYTSGSTGKPKGVVLSHRNMVAGAKSVSAYLENSPSDRILAVLPLSFDAGFSQLTTAFRAGATAVLHDYFFPGDIVKAAERENITGITAVPPLWMQIAEQKWPDTARKKLRYFANTGGKMPVPLLQRLRNLFPEAKPYLMYGLTEAFRSTYLPPEEVDRRPDSIGKAIPNAEILVVNDDGALCRPDEPGELVHRGALVALGYWNDPEKTSTRFRPVPNQIEELPHDELAVWSGDTVRMDDEGFLYFIGRKDDMIKTSGYRVSPAEVEEAGYESGLASEVAAIGVPDERLGQAIVVAAVWNGDGEPDTKKLVDHFKASLPAFMVPASIVWHAALPRSANGKIDRPLLATTLRSQAEDT